MNIIELIEIIERSPSCAVYPSKGLPKIEEKYSLPSDLSLFYETCGGIELFKTSSSPMAIVSPAEVVLANSVLVGVVWEEDISDSWHIIAKGLTNEHITIDFERSRLGRCYDSSFGVHGSVGYCPIIATSFTDLLLRLWNNAGGYRYWLESSFQRIGDAYD